MNYAGTFDFSNVGDALTETTVGVSPVGDISSSPGSASTIIVDDAHLLFSGDYKRSGIDLVLSKDGHEHVVSDYFKGTHRATLSSPDGATLSADLVKALVGEVQVAQLGGGANAAAQEIGTVTKLTGSATAIRNGVSVMLNAGDKVQKGDVVQAGADSSLGLTFIDGTVFGLSANARMVLNEMVYDPNGSSNSSLLSLVQGTITFVAGETAKHGDMRVDTPVATMGIRGTAVLVEIGFEVPGQGGAPPVKFQVLVEPGGRVGSYVLYSKATGQIIGTVDQAGLVTSVTGLGDTSTTPADPLTSVAQGIIQQTLQQYFPNYVPNANPRSNGSGSGSTPADPNSGTSPDPLKFAPPPDVPTGVPFTVPINLPGTPPDTPPINVTIIRFNTAPTIVVAPVVVTLPVNKTSFDIKDQVQITDPDSGDVAVPYVPGTAHIITATGPSNAPAGLDLKALITVDPQTGHVSYNPAAFKFLGEGQTAVYTIGFDSQSGPDTIHETITFTVDGANDAPEVAALLTSAATQGNAAQSISLLTGATDPDSGETATLSVTHVRYAVDGGAASATAPTGFSLTGSTLHVDPANPVFAHLAQGQTMTIVVTYDIIDIHGATVTQTETVTITGTNDLPQVAAALTAAVTQGAPPHDLNLLAGASDPDDGETATLSITNVKYAIDGGAASATVPTGLSLNSATLSVDPSNAAFAHLAQGQTMTIVVSYDVVDIHGATVTQTETVTITGTNDAPQVAAALTDAATQGAPPHDINLLAGASDPDSGETATLSITNVKYAIDGGAASATMPTGLSLNSAILSVDPSNAAFAHLAQGQTMTIVVSYDVIDIHGATVTQTETITITGTNDAPVIDLNGACAGVDATTVIAPDGQAHALFSNVAISDVDDGATIHSIKITWTGRGNDILTLGDCNPNIHVQYVNGGIILSGNASASEYQAFLEAMTLELLGPETPSFTVVVNDGITDSAPATVTVAPPASWNFWTGNANNGNWNSPGNWTLGHVPTAFETAYVSSTTPISFNLGGALALAGLIVIAGTELDLAGTGSLNITGTLVNDGTILLAPGTTFEVNGVVQNEGQLIIDNHAAGSTLLIHDHVTFTGGGTITLDGTADRITGDTSQSTLTNTDNKIDGYGKIGDGHLTLVNGIAGVIAATDFWHGITINTGQGTFTNDGLVVSASLFGGLEITGAVVNHGTLEAHLGLLKVDGAVTGQGKAVIDGGILEFRSASDAHVSFSGNTADLLKLDDVWHFTGTVTGFSFGDTIDLAGVSWWNVRLVDRGNYVEVHYGWGANDFFKIDGDYATNHFLVTTDLHGGAAITWLDQAPQIATDDLQISQSGVTTTISGLSMFDTDAGRRETFSFDVTANGHTLDHGTGRLSNINDELDHGFTYTETSPSATSVGKVTVTVTDSLGASDTVNFIFSTSTAPTTTPIALTGTAGKDVIIASSHDDTLTGGASADQFVFKTPSGHDVITDFTAGQDKIELDFVPAGSHAFQQWLASAATQQGADTLIRFDNADSLLLKHVSVSDLHASDFILHAGVV